MALWANSNSRFGNPHRTRRSKSAGASWRTFSVIPTRASPSTSTTQAPARSSSSTPARSAARASSRSASARPIRSGRTDQWVKVKNPEAPAVARGRRGVGSIILGPEAAASKGRHLADGPAPPLAWPVVHSAAEPPLITAAHLLTRYEARRIAANIAKLPELIRRA